MMPEFGKCEKITTQNLGAEEIGVEYTNVDEQINRFVVQRDRLMARGWHCEELAEFAYWLRAPSTEPRVLHGKEIPLTVMGLTHGNEWAGIGAINDFLDHVYFGTVTVPFSFVMILGNPWAARQNQRFLEKDLNRSFGALGGDAAEQKRAGALAPILDRTAFLLDLHQTREHTAQPFFIFPYNKKSLPWARAIAPHIPIITHWGNSYSSDGMCTDEYTNSRGGVGISIELGQNSFHPYHMGIGLRVIMGAVSTVAAEFKGERVERLLPSCEEIYTWSAVIPYPAGESVGMDEGWFNFREVHAGERLGEADGQVIYAPASGPVIFPQIRRAEKRPRPAELCRILRRVAVHELP